MEISNNIRTAFLDYFAKNDHEIVASGSLVPHNDPTLLFTNAGMVPFKNVFTGAEKRDFTRAATSQKCVRAGGKHNDLDNVGYTARHHTFFEMLGNFSFGDYFKDVAIELAWNLITKEFAVPAERLMITVHADDDEAFKLSRKITGLPESLVLRLDSADNFWSMGNTGSCGPCAEIFYDHGEDVPGGPPGSAEAEGDRFVEIWNLVFMQYNRLSADERVDLPRPSIDTGMGLERVAAVLQGVHNNYDTDLFKALIEACEEVTGVKAEGDKAVSHRVIADHLRAICFLMADGVLPSNEGRGYVLRRIMRRAMRHVHMLGGREPLMWRLVPALTTEMGQIYPELGRAQALITEILKLEEARFQKTLERGLKLLSEETKKLSGATVLSGDTAFKLYDTYGFPLDLTQDVLRSQGRDIDLDGFNIAMERQKKEARANWAGSGEAATEKIWFEIGQRVGATEFLGYEVESADGEVVALVVDGKEVDKTGKGELALIVNQTPFYGESGGQVGDSGIVLGSGDGKKRACMEVSGTRKFLGNLHVHTGKMTSGTLVVGEVVELAVDGERRTRLRANHSSTHLLHRALRGQLGDHVTQKGSLVAPDRLRFDISHPKAISFEELVAIESEVNACIRGNSEVTTRLMTADEAVEHGAIALFGEKYGDEVRVVSMGGEDSTEGEQAPYSMELCGGTHVRRTGDIGFFHIVGESAVASGVRRIEALAGEAAVASVAEQKAQLLGAASALKAAPTDLESRVSALLDERKKLERDLSEARRSMASGGVGGNDINTGEADKEVAGVTFASRCLRDVPAKDLKPMADEIKVRIGSGIIALVTVNESKASLVVSVTDDLTEKFDAVSLVRVGAKTLGGKGGGGRPDMAQAGGPDGTKADAALKAIEKVLSRSGD
ncbi:MAG: alanine--tRNA ligase [Alphaproteobacteria bacterium]|nr:alanine--tRNA ligase [Alphaproteobacteria bacterium]